MPTIKFRYEQQATVACTVHLNVPQEVIDEGEDAVRDYFHDNEVDGETNTEVIDYHDQIRGSLKFQVPK